MISFLIRHGHRMLESPVGCEPPQEFSFRHQRKIRTPARESRGTAQTTRSTVRQATARCDSQGIFLLKVVRPFARLTPGPRHGLIDWDFSTQFEVSDVKALDASTQTARARKFHPNTFVCLWRGSVGETALMIFSCGILDGQSLQDHMRQGRLHLLGRAIWPILNVRDVAFKSDLEYLGFVLDLKLPRHGNRNS